MKKYAPHLFECLECGLITSDESPNPSIYDEAYYKKYLGYTTEDLTRRIMAVRWGMLSRFLNGHRTVFDYGAAAGSFVHSIHRPEGLSVDGYDINPYSPFRGRDIPKRVDVLTLYDVLEHLESPRETIERIWPKLLAVGTPCRDIVSKHSLKDWKHYRPGEHLHYHNTQSLSALFAACGYRVMDRSFTEAALRNPDRPCDIITMIGERE